MPLKQPSPSGYKTFEDIWSSCDPHMPVCSWHSVHLTLLCMEFAADFSVCLTPFYHHLTSLAFCATKALMWVDSD